MTWNKNILYFFLFIFLLTCQSPTDVDVPRLIKIEYDIKKNIELSVDTIDFSFIEKDAFYNKNFNIKNITENEVLIKSIKLNRELRNEPSFFHFDPLQNLKNITLNSTSNSSLDLTINIQQKIVGEYSDSIVIESDSTYFLILKSIVPDIMVMDYGNVDLNLNDSVNIEIKVFNYSNYLRKIEKVKINNDPNGILKLNENILVGKWISANSSTTIKFKTYGKVNGNFTPQIIFETQNGVISKNTCNLNINVN